ncbi:MAG: hypothetical protein NVV69_09640 [Methyloversatilis sp.]|nr:hypothetical protein [Methyloversatilis sp.]MCR6666255.1 hypothetical protein [Methyloversatilis sp.]
MLLGGMAVITLVARRRTRQH